MASLEVKALFTNRESNSGIELSDLESQIMNRFLHYLNQK